MVEERLPAENVDSPKLYVSAQIRLLQVTSSDTQHDG